MILDTTAGAPYYDDYDETKLFHAILFKPGYTIQNRELHQLSTILRTNIKRLAGGLYSHGSIVSGDGITKIGRASCRERVSSPG